MRIRARSALIPGLLTALAVAGGCHASSTGSTGGGGHGGDGAGGAKGGASATGGHAVGCIDAGAAGGGAPGNIGLTIKSAVLPSSDELVLTFSEPLAPLGTVDPCNFRLSHRLTHFQEICSYENDACKGHYLHGCPPIQQPPMCSYYYDCYSCETKPLGNSDTYYDDVGVVVGVTAGTHDDQLVLSLSKAVTPADCATLYLHYAPGSTPISGADGKTLGAIAPAWVHDSETTAKVQGDLPKHPQPSYCSFTCDDGKHDGDETDVDCGGPGLCKRCDAGKRCKTSSDCSTAVCTPHGGGAVLKCDDASCHDGLQDGGETDIDCGGPCPACDGKACQNDADCASDRCVAGACARPIITAITAGRNYTCSVTGAGALKCWGANDTGQLGDGTFTTRLAPVPVVGLGSGVVSASAGFWTTCAMLASGEARCWGENEDGELGTGNTDHYHYSSPQTVVGLGPTRDIAPGFATTCALEIDGTVYCWGFGYLGDQLGSSTELHPVQVVNLSGVSVLHVGDNQACALASGSVSCWGNTYAGTPAPIAGIGGAVSALAVHGDPPDCALTSAGDVVCWGQCTVDAGGNSQCQNTPPAMVAGLGTGVLAVATGSHDACAITSSGGVKCWGLNDHGRLGDGTLQDRDQPVDVVGLDAGVKLIAAGESHTCAVTESDQVYCWGQGNLGQLGNGDTQDHATPVLVRGL